MGKKQWVDYEFFPIDCGILNVKVWSSEIFLLILTILNGLVNLDLKKSEIKSKNGSSIASDE